MAEALLTEAVRRNLSDKLYERRKAAALEVEQAWGGRDQLCLPHPSAHYFYSFYMKLVFRLQVTKHLAQTRDMASVVRTARFRCDIRQG